MLLFEPLNRYEDHMVNTVAQAAELIARRLPGVRVLADTYHMNIEEDDPCAALRAAAGLLGAVHLSDSNRHQPGTGHVPFEAIIATLREIGFDGVLSVECRLRGEPERGRARVRGVPPWNPGLSASTPACSARSSASTSAGRSRAGPTSDRGATRRDHRYVTARGDRARRAHPLVVTDDDISGTFTFLRALDGLRRRPI